MEKLYYYKGNMLVSVPSDTCDGCFFNDTNNDCIRPIGFPRCSRPESVIYRLLVSNCKIVFYDNL